MSVLSSMTTVGIVLLIAFQVPVCALLELHCRYIQKQNLGTVDQLGFVVSDIC
jgi:hypothetical protein